MRYEAGPFAGIRFFRLAEGASCAVRAISRTAGSFLRSRGRGRIAGANHRAGGVNSCTAGGLLCGRGESAYSVLILPRMRARPLRVRGVAPMRASNSVSSIAVHAAASIVSGSKTGSNARLACIGAFWLWGQQLWQRSQPKSQPSRPIPSVGSFSIVWQEIQRPVSITFGATIAPVGQLSMQLWQRPQRYPSKGGS